MVDARKRSARSADHAWRRAERYRRRRARMWGAVLLAVVVASAVWLALRPAKRTGADELRRVESNPTRSSGGDCDVNTGGPLASALRQRNVRLIRQLLHNSIDQSELDGALIAAVEGARVSLTDQGVEETREFLEALLDKGANPNSIARNFIVGERTPLIAACWLPASENSTPNSTREEHVFRVMVSILIRRGADPNGRVAGGYTPLHTCVELCKSKWVEILLEHGADVNARGVLGTTALMIANSVPMKELLLRKGADPNIPDSAGRTPLARALSGVGIGSSRAEVEFLLRHGADPNRRGDRGKTALFFVAESHSVDPLGIAKILLGAGADPLLRDDDGLTAADHAELNLNRELSAFLRETSHRR